MGFQGSEGDSGAFAEPIEVLTLCFSFVLGLFPWGGACAPSVPPGSGFPSGRPFSFLPGSPLGVWGASSISIHIYLVVTLEWQMLAMPIYDALMVDPFWLKIYIFPVVLLPVRVLISARKISDLPIRPTC